MQWCLLINLTRHVKGHVKCHQCVKDKGKGNGLWKLPKSLCAKLVCMCVQHVVVVPSFLGLSPNHPHQTCNRAYEMPSKGQKLGARALGCKTSPKAHVQNWCPCVSSQIVFVVPSFLGLFPLVQIAQKLQGPMSTKTWCMWVYPHVVAVLLFLGLSPIHPHHTCARPYRMSS
jgi:hypothetical protein